MIDEQRIGAASMRAAAGLLGLRAMSLYNHVENRDEPFDAVVDRAVNELGDDPEVGLAADVYEQEFQTGLEEMLEPAGDIPRLIGVRRWQRRLTL